LVDLTFEFAHSIAIGMPEVFAPLKCFIFNDKKSVCDIRLEDYNRSSANYALWKNENAQLGGSSLRRLNILALKEGRRDQKKQIVAEAGK